MRGGVLRSGRRFEGWQGGLRRVGGRPPAGRPRAPPPSGKGRAPAAEWHAHGELGVAQRGEDGRHACDDKGDDDGGAGGRGRMRGGRGRGRERGRGVRGARLGRGARCSEAGGARRALAAAPGRPPPPCTGACSPCHLRRGLAGRHEDACGKECARGGRVHVGGARGGGPLALRGASKGARSGAACNQAPSSAGGPHPRRR
jgi:hypothetical protein